MKDSKDCVKAKYAGLSIYGAKKNVIWVPKVLVTNVQGPKKVWVPKRVTQHMTGDPMMFSSLDENVGGYSDIISGQSQRSWYNSYLK